MSMPFRARARGSRLRAPALLALCVPFAVCASGPAPDDLAPITTLDRVEVHGSSVPDTVERPPTASGIDHIGYGVRDHAHLVEIYERLRDMGIKPSSQLNHRFTTSIYYHDPDGNEVEFSVDNLPTKQECSDFVASDAMAEIGLPPFGYDFDPEELARLHN